MPLYTLGMVDNDGTLIDLDATWYTAPSQAQEVATDLNDGDDTPLYRWIVFELRERLP